MWNQDVLLMVPFLMDELKEELIMNKIGICLDDIKYQSKPGNSDAKALNFRIAKKKTQLSIEEIAVEVGVKGRTFTPAVFKNEKKCMDSFESIQLFALDFDTGVSFTEIADRCKEYSLEMAFAYKSFSYSNENERFRVVFMLDCVVDNSKIARWLLEMLHTIFPEADTSGRDITHMYYGGKGLLNNDFKRITPCNCSDAFSLFLLNNDKNRNYSRKMKRMAERYDIGLVDKKPILFDICLQKMDAVVPKDTYIYIRSVTDASVYQIANYDKGPERERASEAITREKKSVHKEHRSSILSNYERCELLNDFVEGKELDHSDKMHILYNLNRIEGGPSFFLEIIQNYTDDISKWIGQVKFCRARYDKPQNCCGNNFQCKYCDVCKAKNIVQCLARKERIIKVADEKLCSLFEAETDFKEKFEMALKSKQKTVHVVKAQTAIGKTHTYCNYIRDNPEQFFYIAVPTNKLKKEVLSRLDSMGVRAMASLSLEDIDFPSNALKNKVHELYELGYTNNIKKVIKNLVKQEHKNIEFDKAKLQAQLDNLFGFISIIKNMEARVVVTTHAQLLMTHWVIPDKYNIIVDEDIIKTIFSSQRCIAVKDVISLSESFDIIREEREKYKKLLEYKQGIPHRLEDSFTQLEMETINKLDIASAVGCLHKGSVIVRKDYSKFVVLNPVKINKKMVILSATANEIIYERYFDCCKFFECKNAEYKGRVYQYTKFGLSREQLGKLKYKKVKKKIKKIIGEVDYITYKKYAKSRGIYFGNSVGYDELKGNNLAIVGTYHLNPLVYQMIYYCLDNKVLCEKPKNRWVKYNDYEMVYFTYNNVLMREIQFWLISSELEQCIGRARILREDCDVYVFSDFPAEQATFIGDDYLNNENEDVV